MITANELRLGNIIYYSKNFSYKIITIVGLSEKYAHVQYGGVPAVIFYTDMEPIPLTEEILLKCGFLKSRVFDIDYYDLHFDDIVYTCRIIYSCGCFSYMDGEYDICQKPLEYVHQLQNLFFALTGKELGFRGKYNLGAQSA